MQNINNFKLKTIFYEFPFYVFSFIIIESQKSITFISEPPIENTCYRLPRKPFRSKPLAQLECESPTLLIDVVMLSSTFRSKTN